jgi:mono/diheme cytochrome c family protein
VGPYPDLRVALRKWLDPSELDSRVQWAVREARSALGVLPFGYRLGARGGLVGPRTTYEGRLYAPAVFRMVIAGRPADDIAAWLTAEKAGDRVWRANAIRTLIKDPTYHGKRAYSGYLEIDPLVSRAVWQEANIALAALDRLGRIAVARGRPLLEPVCGACHGQDRRGSPGGHSPMYRVITRQETEWDAYYRCCGRGPRMDTCGAPMVRCEQLDAIVRAAIAASETDRAVADDFASLDLDGQREYLAKRDVVVFTHLKPVKVNIQLKWA